MKIGERYEGAQVGQVVFAVPDLGSGDDQFGRDADAVVVDVLGTLVDEPAGICAGIRDLAPSLADLTVDELLQLWQHHIDSEQRRILDGNRPYTASDGLDREAAQLVADAAGIDDPAAVAALALSGRRLPAWPDTVLGLARLAEFPGP